MIEKKAILNHDPGAIIRHFKDNLSHGQIIFGEIVLNIKIDVFILEFPRDFTVLISMCLSRKGLSIQNTLPRKLPSFLDRGYLRAVRHDLWDFDTHRLSKNIGLISNNVLEMVSIVIILEKIQNKHEFQSGQQAQPRPLKRVEKHHVEEGMTFGRLSKFWMLSKFYLPQHNLMRAEEGNWHQLTMDAQPPFL